MTGRTDLDRILDRFLADGPETVADRAIQQTLDEIDRTAQRRRLLAPWRFDLKISTTRLAAAAVVVVVLGGALYMLAPRLGPGSVAPTATPVPTATRVVATAQVPTTAPSTATPIVVPALTESFTSAVHGYTIHYPAGWTSLRASKPWVGESLLWGDPALDDLFGADVRIVAASQPLGSQTGEEWLAAKALPTPCNGPSMLPTAVSVGPAAGMVTLNGCPASGGIVSGGVIYDVVVVVAQRGYDFTIDGNVDAAYVEALLATVVFQPKDAVDPSPGPS